MKNQDILIVGVGGQGTLLASVILGNLAMDANLDVKLSEVHGMAQRGGSVVTHVRMSEKKVAVPMISEGGADCILAFEMLEAERYLAFLKKGGTIFVNQNRIPPMPVITGAAQYPENIEAKLEAWAGSVFYIDALAAAKELGQTKVVNVVMLGALSRMLPFTQEAWDAALKKSVKPAFLELNRKAFAMGAKLASK